MLLMSAVIMHLEFEVLTVIMKSTVFRNVTPCSLLKVSLCFGEEYCHHIQGQRINLDWTVYPTITARQPLDKHVPPATESC
jgi:hypothetical protein